eukprot:m.1310490 g.1310490  ORF g.1310490 m.1310490 type:complete len:52 (-) comp24826_c0_seq1:1174-1329(-)
MFLFSERKSHALVTQWHPLYDYFREVRNTHHTQFSPSDNTIYFQRVNNDIE